MRFTALLVFSFLSVTTVLRAETKFVRWTFAEDKNSNFQHIVGEVNRRANLTLTLGDFKLIESTRLANQNFAHYARTIANIPVRGQNLRIWTDTQTGETVQVEAAVAAPPPSRVLERVFALGRISSASTTRTVQMIVHAHPDDRQIRGIDWQDEFQGTNLVRRVVVKGKHGRHTIVLSATDGSLISKTYEPYPQAERAEFNVPAMVYPIWEEYEGVPASDTRVRSELKYLNSQIRVSSTDPYLALKSQRYLGSKFDPAKGLTEEGRKQGFWSMGFVRGQAQALFEQIPLVDNSFTNGAYLDGRYATINFHPDVKNQTGLSFTPKASAQFRPNWIQAFDNPMDWEMVPQAGLLGKTVTSIDDILNRPARRLPDHNMVGYLNDGFDEAQVYYAITQMFDSLRPMGFTDPGLSTRPFHAYLYDPDISMRDNAYYTDDTINFTTYSSAQHNMARDNSTIWHELGHGVMDRLMGDHIVLADTGGLAEGMADFVAQLVINEVTSGSTFTGKDNLRIFNHTAFHLTNESHDDGEAYGGAMNDMLVAAMALEGRVGLQKVTDLTLEAMRLTRNHPGLTANGWFDHMLFADDVGHLPVRRPGEMRRLIIDALAGRNFNLDGAPVATFELKHAGLDVTATSAGSRANPIPVRLAAYESKAYTINVQLKNTPTYEFQFPVTVKVSLRGGPIQGAIRWKNEAATPFTYTLNSENDIANIELAAEGTCDEINRPDNSCVDFAYVQIWNRGETSKPQAKKRFYLRVYPTSR